MNVGHIKPGRVAGNDHFPNLLRQILLNFALGARVCVLRFSRVVTISIHGTLMGDIHKGARSGGLEFPRSGLGVKRNRDSLHIGGEASRVVIGLLILLEEERGKGEMTSSEGNSNSIVAHLGHHGRLRKRMTRGGGTHSLPLGSGIISRTWHGGGSRSLLAGLG